MKRIAATIAVLLAVCLAAPAHADDAKALYSKKCGACHGPDGKGKTAMGQKLGAQDLTASKMSEADMEKTIENGKGKMPAVKTLTTDEAKAVAKYIKGGLK
jgi:mono/diheme cytochrome c family protein